MKFKIVACNLLAEKQPSNSRRQHNAITLHRKIKISSLYVAAGNTNVGSRPGSQAGWNESSKPQALIACAIVENRASLSPDKLL